MSMTSNLSNDPLHGVSLKKIVTELSKNDFTIGNCLSLSCPWKLISISIPFVNLTPVFNENLEITSNNDGSFTLNKDDILKKQNYKYLIEFATDLSLKYYNMCIINIENYLFQNINKQRAFDLCNFLIENNIYDRKLFIYTAICYYYLNDTQNTLKYIQKSDYMINKYNILQDFYNNYNSN